MKNKDSNWYDQKIKKLKKAKKELQIAMRKASYVRSKDRKKVADNAKREKRAYKRAEKQNWKETVKNEIEKGDI